MIKYFLGILLPLLTNSWILANTVANANNADFADDTYQVYDGDEKLIGSIIPFEIGNIMRDGYSVLLDPTGFVWGINIHSGKILVPMEDENISISQPIVNFYCFYESSDCSGACYSQDYVQEGFLLKHSEASGSKKIIPISSNDRTTTNVNSYAYFARDSWTCRQTSLYDTFYRVNMGWVKGTIPSYPLKRPFKIKKETHISGNIPHT